jgi:hypothetical protein
MGGVLAALTLGLGVVFGFCFDTVPVVREVPEEAPVVRDADAPLTAERRSVDDEPLAEPVAEPVGAPAATSDDGAVEP